MAFAGIIVLAVYIFYLSKTLPSLAELENPKLEEATKIYSSDGELIDKFFLKTEPRLRLTIFPRI